MIPDAESLEALWLSLKLAGLATFVLLIIGAPLAWWLRHSGGIIRTCVNMGVTLPLVLPPSVLGLYLLIAMGPGSPLMGPLHLVGVQSLNFTFSGLVIGSVLYSLPFMVQPLKSTFERLDPLQDMAARLMGANAWDRFVTLGLRRVPRALAGACLLVFAHTLGEFGVVLMIGGSIPGQTRLASIRLYELTEGGQFSAAHGLALSLIAIGVAALMVFGILNRRPVVHVQALT